MLKPFEFIAIIINLAACVLLIIGYTGVIRVNKNHNKILKETEFLTEQESNSIRKFARYLVFGGILFAIASVIRIVILFLK